MLDIQGIKFDEALDHDDEIEIIMAGENAYVHRWLGAEEALVIINHLMSVFDMTVNVNHEVELKESN